MWLTTEGATEVQNRIETQGAPHHNHNGELGLLTQYSD
jgi:hypothetical protein